MISNSFEVWLRYICDKYASADVETKIENRVRYMYEEPGRYYHNLSHIEYCLSSLQDNEGWFPDELATALIFHDILPDIESSKQFYLACLGILIKDSIFNKRVLAFIDATEHTKPVPTIPDYDYVLHKEAYRVQTTQCLIHDIDLKILGSTRKEYNEYATHIRLEYEDINKRLFFYKRISLLSEFLSRPSIYITEGYKRLYEDKARANLKSELTRLVLQSANY
jgi:predicted metal-dependent HD superfamily phosphohydrolase